LIVAHFERKVNVSASLLFFPYPKGITEKIRRVLAGVLKEGIMVENKSSSQMGKSAHIFLRKEF